MTKKKVIITGGTGYIGSCTAALLNQIGFEPIILDNFSTSARPKKPIFRTEEIELTDKNQIKKILGGCPQIYAVFHFAAKALVPESTVKAWDYFHNNINATLNVAECAVELNIPYLIHSSTCAVYGYPESVPIRESAPLRPETPYGQSKLAAEGILEQYSKWKQLKVVNLRYFNPAGAFTDLGLGELHSPETHLIPNLVKSFMLKAPFETFGNDYPTPDGTCIRDFVHIRDLAQAHLMALNYLESHPEVFSSTINIGKGCGVSVGEAIKAAEKVFGFKGRVEFKPRRQGDPAHLVADTSKMKTLFKWSPELSLESMIEDHWKFMQGQLH